MLMSEPPKGQEHKYTCEKYLKSRNIGWLQLNLDEVEEMWFNDSEKKIYELQEVGLGSQRSVVILAKSPFGIIIKTRSLFRIQYTR